MLFIYYDSIYYLFLFILCEEIYKKEVIIQKSRGRREVHRYAVEKPKPPAFRGGKMIGVV